MSQQPDVVRDLMADGIAVAVSTDGDMPVSWLAVVETIDANGTRCMWRIASEGLSPWDALKMHEYSLTKLRAQIMKGELGL